MIKPDQAVSGGGEHPANCIRRKQADRRAVPERRKLAGVKHRTA